MLLLLFKNSSGSHKRNKLLIQQPGRSPRKRDQWKKLTPEGSVLCGSMYATSSTQQSWEDGEEEIKGCQGDGWGGEWLQVEVVGQWNSPEETVGWLHSATCGIQLDGASDTQMVHEDS